jgi:putative glutamine amidotransferase
MPDIVPEARGCYRALPVSRNGRAPIVGITVYGPVGAMRTYGLPRSYVDAVVQAGGAPVLLPSTEAIPRETFDVLDALVLAGGGDIDPSHYGTDRPDAVSGVALERDRFELELARRALEARSLPVLGICRGMQLLNVLCGGDLEQHLPDRSEALAHRGVEGKPCFHDVRMTGGGVFEEIYGALEFPVNSRHHQGVRRIGAGLEVAGHAPDGLVEALVFPDHPFAVAVQWHPEAQVADDPIQRRLFRALVERAKR